MKKKLAATLSVVLILGLATLGILAYLTDTDHDVNVMTLGNVEIEQHEQQIGEDGTTLEPFKNGKGLYPGTEISKIVTVENTGKSDCYVRTLIAFEDIDSETFKANYKIDEFGGFTDNTWYGGNAEIEIDGVHYTVVEFIHKEIVKKGETTGASLLGVNFGPTCTNEDMEALGGTYEILVLSQAVQVEGFADAQTALDTAFGDVNADNAFEWFKGMKPETNVSEAADLHDALKYSGVVNLNENLDVAATDNVQLLNEGNTVVINGNDNDVKAGATGEYAAVSSAGANTTYNDVNFESLGGGIAATEGSQVTFNGGSVAVNTANTAGRYNFYVVGEGTVVTINDGEFSFSKTLNQKRAYIYAGSGATVYVNGGTFGPASTRSGYTEGILGDGTVIITGGTFGFDPSKWVADGYEAVQNGTTWTVSAK